MQHPRLEEDIEHFSSRPPAAPRLLKLDHGLMVYISAAIEEADQAMYANKSAAKKES